MAEITISQMITRLSDIQKEYGDIPVCINDESVGYPIGITADVLKTERYDENGYYVHKEGSKKICVIWGEW
jgi:hypothetical protein